MRPSSEDRAAIEAMFAAIAPGKAQRWSYLFSLPSARWNKLSPLDGWPLSRSCDASPDEPIATLLNRPPLSRHLDTRVLVLRCGHSRNPGLSAMPLRDVFPDGQWDHEVLFEGFVCVVPGKIAIATNHEGGIYVQGA